MKTLWILEKKHRLCSGWVLCFGAYLGYADKKAARTAAKRLTEQSIGWKFRAVPYDRRKK